LMVQQMQPLLSSTMVSSMETKSWLSMLMSPN